MKNDVGAACSTYGGEEREMYTTFLLGKSEGKRELLRWVRWEDNIKMDLPEMVFGGGEWTGLVGLRIWTGGGLL